MATLTEIQAAAQPGPALSNLSVARLVELSLVYGEGLLTADGALVVETGQFTGRSPRDRFIVAGDSVQAEVDWGSVNQPLAPEAFADLWERALAYLSGRRHFIFNGYAGADRRHRLPIRVVTEHAWQSLFANQLFVRPSPEELAGHEPHLTVLAVPGCTADPALHGTRSGTCIALDLEGRRVLITGTEYAGEIKKSVFSYLNYFLPPQGVLPMHCAANVGQSGDVALFFGLSGTGKTTLSADPYRSLLGDDEHGWSDQGIFNLEGGCYAKCIGLDPEHEPQIHAAIRFGTVLENVVVDPDSRHPDYRSDRLTENTRAAYPLEYIPGACRPAAAGHPTTVFFLTADAFGVLPPISMLTPEQAVYYFLSGYTSKLAGTERGVTRPEATFSSCFGSPFLPRSPLAYARMLAEKLRRHAPRVFLVNTGWTGGTYGVGQRIDLRLTRAMVTAALSGSLKAMPASRHPIFGLFVPRHCPGVPDRVLDPRSAWADPAAYDAECRRLAGLFRANFHRFDGVDDAIRSAGPQVDGHG